MQNIIKLYASILVKAEAEVCEFGCMDGCGWGGMWVSVFRSVSCCSFPVYRRGKGNAGILEQGGKSELSNVLSVQAVTIDFVQLYLYASIRTNRPQRRFDVV